MKLNIALLGGPGSGKGTQAPLLAKHYNLIHLSTGDLFRSEIERQTDIGKKVQALVNSGAYCPDDLVLDILNNHIVSKEETNGFILDGVPRTLQQAEMMDGINYQHPIPITVVVNLQVDEQVIIQRIQKRSQIEGRSDDQIEIVKQRIANYRTLTEPLIDYYSHQNRLVQVDGMHTIEEVSQDIIAKIEGFLSHCK